MAHTFTNLLTHVIFSTKDRLRLIGDEIRPRVWAYMGGIVRELKGSALMIDGTDDHVHLLLRTPADVNVADCLRIVKANSSRWVHEQWPERHTFAWQRGYGAFSVSESSKADVIRYIQGQQVHHRKMSFQEEFVAFLKKNGIEYDERYLWD